MAINNNSNIPDFFIAGAPRAGTTTLYHLLHQHPEIFMSPVKEPHFFAMDDIEPAFLRNKIQLELTKIDIEKFFNENPRPFIHRYYFRDWQPYLRLFEHAQNEKRIGEASTSYLWSPSAAAKIKEKIPGAKIIISLRNPVERAFSHYLMERRMILTRKDFHQHLKEDNSNPVYTWGASPMYIGLGKYYAQVKRFLDIFGKENVFIGLFEELKMDYLKHIRNIYSFLGVDYLFSPAMPDETNPSALPKFEWIEKAWDTYEIKRVIEKTTGNRFRKAIKELFYTSEISMEMQQEDKEFLRKEFMPDILKLQDLIQRDLSAWMK